VYIGMDIGTAKPDAATLARYPHHLIDLVTPAETYSGGRFLADARRVMDEIAARGKVPLLVGGTMLYFKLLREGIADMPTADPALRADIDRLAAERGWPAVHAELARLDPAAAAKIDPNHSHRLQRALELVRLTGRPLAELHAGGEPPPPLDALALALLPSDRAELHRRIALRFKAMIDLGLIDELAALRRRHELHPDLPSMRCVGYRQAYEYLDGRCGRAEMIERGVAATRQLAKRQLTWLRSLPFEGFDAAAPDLAALVARRVDAHLSAALQKFPRVAASSAAVAASPPDSALATPPEASAP
jgi:tRNA dimethylallyltransferase